MNHSTLSGTHANATERLLEAYDGYRRAMQALLAAERIVVQHQAWGNLAELRDRYLAMVKAVSHGVVEGHPFEIHERKLRHIKKTIAGLERLIVEHAVRKLRPSQRRFSLLHRVREITITHPASAPPAFA